MKQRKRSGGVDGAGGGSGGGCWVSGGRVWCSECGGVSGGESEVGVLSAEWSGEMLGECSGDRVEGVAMSDVSAVAAGDRNGDGTADSGEGEMGTRERIVELLMQSVRSRRVRSG